MARKKFKNSSTFSNWRSKKKPMANGGIISDPPTKTNTSKDAVVIKNMRYIFPDEQDVNYFSWDGEYDRMSPELKQIVDYGLKLRKGDIQHNPKSAEGKAFESYARRVASPEAWMKLMPSTMGAIFDPTNDSEKFKYIKNTWKGSTPEEIEKAQAWTMTFDTPNQNLIEDAKFQEQYAKDIQKESDAKFIAQQNQEAEDFNKQRKQVGIETGIDPYTGKNIPQWQRMGASSADEWYNDMHDSGAKEILKTTVVEPLYEATGIPAAERIYKDPLGHLKAVGNTVGDLVMMPLTAFTGDSNVNPLTGEKYYEGVDKTLDVAGVVPALGAMGKTAKNLKIAKGLSKSGVQNLISPIKHRKDIKNLNKQYSDWFDNKVKTPEVQKRLKKLGINPNDIEKPTFTTKAGEDSWYNFETNTINVDPVQAEKLLKEGFELNPSTIFEHELGHWMQREAYKNSAIYKTKLKNYEKQLAEFPKIENKWKAGSAKVKEWEEKVAAFKKKHGNKTQASPAVEKEYQQLIKERPPEAMDLFYKNPITPPEKPRLVSDPTKADTYLQENIYPHLDFYSDDSSIIGWMENMRKVHKKNPRMAENYRYFKRGSGGAEAVPFVREFRQNMKNAGIIDDIYAPISKENIKKFITETKGDRISSFIEKSDIHNLGERNIETLYKALNNLPAALPAGLAMGVGAGAASQAEFAQGGYLNNPPYKQQVGPIAKPMTNYIPMNPNRPFYVDDEGMSRSEYKITVSFDDNSYVLPTVWEGKQHTEEEAINKFLETGEHMGKYKTQKEAEKASQVRTAMYNMHPAYANKNEYGGHINTYKPVQYKNGGFFGGDNKFGNFVGNAGLALADNSLALVGATDVIGEKNYLGDNASDWAKGTDIAGEITQVAGQVAATAIGGPAAGMALGAVQNTVGGLTDKEVTEAEAMASQLSNIAGQGFMMVNPGNIMNNPTTTAMANGGKIGDPPRKKYLITIPGTGETKEYMLTKEQADAFSKVNEMNTMLYEASKDRLGIVDNEGYKALNYKGSDQIGDTRIASGTIDIDKDFGAPRAFLEDPNYKPEDNPLLYNAGWDTMKKQKFYFDNIYKWNKLIQNDPTLKKDLSIGEDYRAGLRHMYTGKPVETETPPVDNNPGRIQGGAVKSVHDYGDIRQVGTSTYVPDNVQLVGVAKDKAGKQMVDNTGKLSNIYSAYTEGGLGTGVQGYSTDRPDNIITQEQEAFRKNKSANVRDFQTTAIKDNKAYGGKMLYPDGGPLNPALMNQLSGNVPYTIPSGSISSGHGGEFTGFGGHTTRQKMTPGMSGDNMSIDQMNTTSMVSPAEYAKMAGTNAIGGVQDFTRSMQGMMPTEGAYTPPVQFATSTFGNGGYMAMGGDTSRNPLTEFNGGGTHEENEYGGIPQGPTALVEDGETKLNPDDYIFSNRIKVPGKKTTFADESKKINKKYSLRENDTIDDSQKRRYLETLMNLQEGVKERKAQKHLDALVELGYAPQLPSQPDSNTQSSIGAYPIPNSPMPQQGMFQMTNGGKKPINPFSVNANAGFQGNVLDYADQGLQDVIYSDIAQQIGDPRFALKQEAGRMNPVEGRGSMDGVQRANYFGSPEYALQQDARNMTLESGRPAPKYISKDSSTGEDINYKKAAKAVIGSSGLDVESFGQDVGLNPLQIASQYAPIAANIAGALNRDTLDAQDYQVTPQNIDPVTMNINPQLRANEQSFQGTEQAIRGAVAGNAGAYLANVGQAQGSKQGADARAYTQKENYDNQMAMLADKYNSQIGMQADLANANVGFQVDDWNARSKANQFAQLQDAAYNLQGLGQADMNNQLYLESIKAANPNYAPKGNMSYMPWFKGE